MQKILLSLVTASLFVTILSAADNNATKPTQDAINTGWYLGLGLGATRFMDDDIGDSFDSRPGGVNLDQDTDTGFKLYAGYKFNTIVGVEASYVNYGKFTYTDNSGLTTTTLNPESLNVAANLGYDFLNDQLRPYALVGLGYVDFAQGGYDKVYSTESSFGMVFGMGVEYTPKNFHGIGFRASIDRTMPVTVQSYDNPTKDDKAFVQPLCLYSIGVNYKF